MSRFSERSPKFKVSITDQLRSVWTRLPWPSPGQGEADDPARGQGFFRSYGKGVTRVSREPDPGLTRDPNAVNQWGIGQPWGFPRTRNWPVTLREGSGSAVAISDKFLGYALIRDIQARFFVANQQPWPTYSLYASDNALGGGGGQAVGFVPPGTRVFDSLDFIADDGSTAATADGFTLFNITDNQRYEIMAPIYLPEFFLKFKVTDSTAFGAAAHALISVVEGLTKDQLDSLLTQA